MAPWHSNLHFLKHFLNHQNMQIKNIFCQCVNRVVMHARTHMRTDTHTHIRSLSLSATTVQSTCWDPESWTLLFDPISINKRSNILSAVGS